MTIVLTAQAIKCFDTEAYSQKNLFQNTNTMVPTSQTAWAGSQLCPWLPVCTRFVFVTSMFLELLVLLEKHQVQLTKQNRAVPFNALEIILARSLLAYTQEFSLEKFNVARVFGAPQWYLFTSVPLWLHVPRITQRQKDGDMPATGSELVLFSMRTTSGTSKFRSNVNILEVETGRRTLT